MISILKFKNRTRLLSIHYDITYSHNYLALCRMIKLKKIVFDLNLIIKNSTIEHIKVDYKKCRKNKDRYDHFNFVKE